MIINIRNKDSIKEIMKTTADFFFSLSLHRIPVEEGVGGGGGGGAAVAASLSAGDSSIWRALTPPSTVQTMFHLGVLKGVKLVFINIFRVLHYSN